MQIGDNNCNKKEGNQETRKGNWRGAKERDTTPKAQK